MHLCRIKGSLKILSNRTTPNQTRKPNLRNKSEETCTNIQRNVFDYAKRVHMIQTPTLKIIFGWELLHSLMGLSNQTASIKYFWRFNLKKCSNIFWMRCLSFSPRTFWLISSLPKDIVWSLPSQNNFQFSKIYSFWLNLI